MWVLFSWGILAQGLSWGWGQDVSQLCNLLKASGLKDSASKVITWLLRGGQYLITWASLLSCWQRGSWLFKASDLRETHTPRYMLHYSLISEVTYCDFHTDWPGYSGYSVRGAHLLLWIPGGEFPWDASWRLVPIIIIFNFTVKYLPNISFNSLLEYTSKMWALDNITVICL